VTDEETRTRKALVIGLTAIVTFVIGTLAGMAAGGAVGAVHRRRVTDTFEKLARPKRRRKPEDLEAAVLAALREDEATSDLDLHVHVAEAGLIELTGVVGDATVRRVAADVARAVPGVEVVVNRVMLRGATGPGSRPDLRPA